MTAPLDNALRLIQHDPDHASTLYELLVWATSARDDPEHEAQLDQVERLLYSFTEESEAGRAAYRRSRTIQAVHSEATGS